MTSMPKTGRPKKNDGKKFFDGELHKVLAAKLPTCFIRGGRVDTTAVSEATDNVRYTVYRWMNEEKLSPKAVQALLRLSNETDELEKKGALKLEDLLPFMFKA